MGHRKTYRSELRACAVERHGYVTVDDTVRLGVPDEVLERLVERGHLVDVGQELFRLDGVPRSRSHVLAEAVLRVGPDAYLSHDAVLALHSLTDTSPSPVRVSLPRPARAAVPASRIPSDGAGEVEVLHHEVPPEDLTTYQGIRSTTVARALVDCRSLLPHPVLAEAADRAVGAGLLLRRERHAVLEALESV